MKLCQILFFSLFLSFMCRGQNLSGVWEGSSSMGTIRLVVVHKGDSCFGYVFESSMGQCTAHFEGKFNTAKKELTGSSPAFIHKDFGHGLARYTLVYDSTDGSEKLLGKVRPKSAVAQFASFGMTLQCTLYRTEKIPDTTLFMAARLNSLQAGSPAVALQKTNVSSSDSIQKPVALLANRASQVLHNISAPAGTIQCTLYDNGVYDHDTVTVIHNGKIIIDAAEISANALKFEIVLSKEQPVHEIVFYANNLGEIPPNTGMLLIETKEKRYQLDFTADRNTNGKVVVRLR